MSLMDWKISPRDIIAWAVIFAGVILAYGSLRGEDGIIKTEINALKAQLLAVAEIEARLEAKVVAMEVRLNDQGLAIVEMRSDLRHIREAVDKIAAGMTARP